MSIKTLIELSNKHDANSVEWKKTGSVFYSAEIDGVLIEVNVAIPSCRFGKGKWRKLWDGTRASVKAQALRMFERMATEPHP